MNNTFERSLPVRPNLDQLRNQAKDLLKAFKKGDPDAIAEFAGALSAKAANGEPKLSDAQWVLAKSYGASNWNRLVECCSTVEAIWKNDIEGLRALIKKHPHLLVESVRIRPSNWGSPMAYAANLGHREMCLMLAALGAQDLQHAFERACLQGKIETARMLFDRGARPDPKALLGPCETLNPQGLELLLNIGGEYDLVEAAGAVLQTYSRSAAGKHSCLELLIKHGLTVPETPPMALHRGRIDLLEQHLSQDPKLIGRTFSHREIYPLELGCSEDPTYALHGTPLAGGTLLHMAVDFDDFEIAEWLLAKGAEANAKAGVDEDGFGGYTALFGTVVSQPYRVGVKGHERFAKLLLQHGADASIRASLRKELRFVEDETLHEFRDVTAGEWGERFQDQDWVNPAALHLVRG
jgi:ankyrin repeat protein